MPTIDQIIAEAKRVANRRGVVDDANDFAQSEAASRTAAERLTPGGTAKAYGKPVAQAARAAAIPASFLGGPVGLAAGGYLAAQGAADAIEDPSAMNLSMAALGALPVAGPLMRGGKALAGEMRAERAIGDMRKTYGAGDMGATVGREVPYRAGGGTSAPESMGPLNLGGPETLMQRARAQVDRSLGGQQPQSTGRPVADEMPTLESLAAEADNFDNGAVSSPMAYLDRLQKSRGFSAVDDGATEGAAYRIAKQDALRGTPADIPQNPVAQQLEAGRQQDLDEFLRQRGLGEPTAAPASPAQAVNTLRGGRRGDMHGRQTTGGEFGFEDLPKIPESELARLQALMKRVTGK